VRFRRRPTRPDLSVCCVTDRSPEQTLAALDSLRSVAAEVVIGVDPRRAADLDAYAAVADRALVVPGGPLERSIAAVHAACAHDWVFRIDSDEVASAALVAALPELIAGDDTRQYAFTRRWLLPDGTHWVDEQPWWPDWQVRLVRRSTASFSTDVHVPVDLDPPRRFALEPIYHATAALLTAVERQRKVLEYEVVHRGGPDTLRGPKAVIYEPERFALATPVAVPHADQAAIAELLRSVDVTPIGAPSPPGVALDDALPRRRADAPAPSIDDEVAITVLEDDLRFVAGQTRTLTVEVTNRSATPWSNAAAVGGTGHVASYRWQFPDGRTEEGARSLLPAPVEPGEAVVLPVAIAPPSTPGPARLLLGVVDEHVRWLAGGTDLALLVIDPPPLPVRREVRPRSAASIPKVLHRVWLGDAPLPDSFAEYGETWQRLHPGWEVRLWTDADAPSARGQERARNLAERADLVRYEVLRRHGGIYIDTDVECLRPIDPLVDGVLAFSSYEVPGRLCNAVMGAVPGHPAIERLTELAAVTAGFGTFPEATATTFSTYVLERFPDVTLFGPDRFYPHLWDGTENLSDDPPYARHHWAKNWVPTP
jgi:hypothetical protein